jgi:acyl dehydratase
MAPDLLAGSDAPVSHTRPGATGAGRHYNSRRERRRSVPADAGAPGADDAVTFSKTVGESDVYLFAGITGDLSPVHTDHEFMKRNSPFGERIAHGVLVLGFTSAASTIAADRLMRAHGWKSMASLGYDGIRFVAPVRIGDTITVRYRITARDTARRRTTSEFEVVNQRDETVLVGRHIMKWFE